jgi:Animal haem peroxidase
MGAISYFFRLVNRFIPWYRLPFFTSVLNIVALQHDLRRRNLYSTSRDNPKAPAKGDFDVRGCRTADGSYNDLSDPAMGMCGTRFGRNVPIKYTYGETIPQLLTPNPRLISNSLLARKEFIPVSYLNLFVAAWLQFMTHDWFNHGDSDPDRLIDLTLPAGDQWSEPNHKPGHLSIRATAGDPNVVAADDGMPAAFRNHETHWWDGSQIYGSKDARVAQMRTTPDGKLVHNGQLYLDDRKLLAIDPANGVELAGNNGNWWIGLSLLSNLFMREHNVIAAHLKVAYPMQTDEWIFQKARLINAALMTKIHAVEWTPSILNMPQLRFGMRGNWWGLLGEEYERAFGRDMHNERISGIPGSETEHHGVPYSLTEEFIAVYRMHSLIPDEICFRRLSDEAIIETRPLQTCTGAHTREVYDKTPTLDALHTFGITNPGALTLHNYPNTLRHLHSQDGQIIDLASIDIVRDRERGVPRYCEMRRLLRMTVPRTFNQLTGGNRQTAAEIAQIYDHVEDVDLLIGSLAEPLPPGFGFSDTAFRLFVVMATRRIKSDRFYTNDFNDKTYTPEGMRWIRDNGFATVLTRHHPELQHKVDRVRNAFFMWPLD